MIGCGSMGGSMALLFAEHGLTVYVEDPSEENLKSLLDSAHKEGLSQKIKVCEDYAELCQSLSTPRVFILSLPHGEVGDTVVDDLRPYLDPGDIIVDASNENWQTTQQRQGKLVTQNVYYVGMGVSGGYQSARRGPTEYVSWRR
jgi:6-phosphogluconate dehydrogenase